MYKIDFKFYCEDLSGNPLVNSGYLSDILATQLIMTKDNRAKFTTWAVDLTKTGNIYLDDADIKLFTDWMTNSDLTNLVWLSFNKAISEKVEIKNEN